MNNQQPALSATSGSGTQSTTQDPQSTNQANNLGAQNSGIQTSIPSNALESEEGGIPLYSTPIPTVNLNQSIQAPAASAKTVQTTHHAVNPVMLGFAGILLLVAIILFWNISRSAKNTTV
jgi:hypothetical protein